MATKNRQSVEARERGASLKTRNDPIQRNVKERCRGDRRFTENCTQELTRITIRELKSLILLPPTCVGGYKKKRSSRTTD